MDDELKYLEKLQQHNQSNDRKLEIKIRISDITREIRELELEEMTLRDGLDDLD
jgi:hypothetical protein